MRGEAAGEGVDGGQGEQVEGEALEVDALGGAGGVVAVEVGGEAREGGGVVGDGAGGEEEVQSERGGARGEEVIDEAEADGEAEAAGGRVRGFGSGGGMAGTCWRR